MDVRKTIIITKKQIKPEINLYCQHRHSHVKDLWEIAKALPKQARLRTVQAFLWFKCKCGSVCKYKCSQTIDQCVQN